MSKPELDIIHSPEAETFLQMVTKGFYDRSYIGLWIYEVIGREWDELRRWSEGMRTEIHPQTCTWSIAVWEWVYGIEPDENMTLPLRRQRLLQKISGARPVNQDLFRRNIANILSIPIESVTIDELAGPYAFSVSILNGPDNVLMSCGPVLSFIRKVKPAHLTLTLHNIIVAPEIKKQLFFTPDFHETYSKTVLPDLEPDFPGSSFGLAPFMGQGRTITRIPVVPDPDVPELQAVPQFAGHAGSCMRTVLPVLEDHNSQLSGTSDAQVNDHTNNRTRPASNLKEETT